MLLGRALEQIQPGQVRLLFCGDPRRSLMRARYGPLVDEALHTETRYIAVSWRELPPLREQLAFVLQRFAEMSQALFPRWSVADVAPALSSWRSSAGRLCEARRLPLVKNCAPAVQLRQLGLTLGRELTVLLTAGRTAHRQTALAALSRTAEWIARATDARVALLVPTLFRGHQELQRIAYGELWLDEPQVAEQRGGRADVLAEDLCEIALWPIPGRPHGASPGEQLLASAVSADPELSACFLFNQRLQTVAGTRYCVDLLWRAGRIVVEVDGYLYHSNREAFAADRQRDYELLLSGYRVLRLPHEEVMLDLAGVLIKIRNVTRFAVQQAVSAKESP